MLVVRAIDAHESIGTDAGLPGASTNSI